MDFIQALILGIVEGATEFLPISSTGHLILATDLLDIYSTDFIRSFTVIIQTGAILAVVFLYWRNLMGKKRLLPKVVASFIPTAIVGFFMYDYIKKYFLDSSTMVLWSLFLGGIALILMEYFFKKKSSKEKKFLTIQLESISYKKAFIIGIFQSISVIPGVSRALATIFGGMIVGFNRKNAVEFSFLLAIPTMIAATILDLTETKFSYSSNEWAVLAVGFITSFITAYLVIKWFIKYISNHSFIIFGVYRIILSAAFYLLFYK